MRSRRKRVYLARRERFQAALEHLEDRTLLSGNVLVSLSASGVLSIRGDQSANNIAVQQTASGVQVSSTDSGATEINGGAGPFNAASVTSITVQLKGGNNTLQLGDPSGDAIDLSGKLTISATSGNNMIGIANLKIGKGLTIAAGRGDNSIAIGSTSNSPGGDPLTDVDLGSVSVGGNLTVSAGSGNDTVALVNVSVGGKTSLGTGSGDDNVSLMSSDGATLSKRLVVSGGAGADQVLMAGYTVDGNTLIDTRQGNDTIGTFANTFDRRVAVQGGGGKNSYLTNSADFPNTFKGPSPNLRNLQTQPTDVTNNDAAFMNAFGWASDLLDATGLIDLAPTAVNQSFTTAADTPLTTGNLLTNDTDPQNQSLSVASISDSKGNAVPLGTTTTLPSGATLNVSANGAFTYNPNGAFNSLTGSQTAADSFTYTIDNGHGGTSASATVTITITAAAATPPAVQNPVAVADSFSTTEGTPLTSGNLLANDTDPNAGATLSVASVFDSSGNTIPLGTATTLPSGALLTVNANGTFTYDPNGAFDAVNAGDTASDSFTYNVSDNLGGKSASPATVTISVTAAQPVANNDAFTTDAATPLTTGNVLTNDTDTNPGATLKVAGVSDASGATVPLGVATALPSGALLTINADGTFVYDPNGAFNSVAPGQSATDSFTYTASDNRGATSASAGTVTITIAGSQNPIAVNDDFSTDPQTPLSTGNLLTNDIDPNPGATLSVATVHDSQGNTIPLGTATLLPSGALLTVNANGTFNYNPNGAFQSLGSTGTAMDTYTYTDIDSLGKSSLDAATVTVTIGAAKPVAVSEAFSTDALTPLTTANLLAGNSGTGLTVATIHDADGNTVPLGTATTLPSGALLTVNANGTFTYNPNGAFSSLGPTATATDTFTYTVVNSQGETSANAATVNITITSAKPVAVNESFSTDSATPLTSGNLLTNDTDPNPGATLTVATVQNSSGTAVTLGTATLLPSGAMLTVNANGTFTYNPNGAFPSLAPGVTATDTFSYTVIDSLGGTSASATVTISITAPKPVAVNDAFSTDADTPLSTGNVLTNDTDATPGATLAVATVHDANGTAIPLGTATVLPSGALLTINADGTFDYDPNGAFDSLASGATATDKFTYTVSDNFGETSLSAATVTITITGV